MSRNIFKSKEYQAWCSMRKRCNNKNDRNYFLYGGRGITVCSRWDSFGLFLNDIGFAPSKEHSLDRIDGNGDYEPDNVRWATKKEQARNRRNSLSSTIDGVTKALTEWSEEAGLKYVTVWYRVTKLNMPIEQALRKEII